ncbi:MAG: hypothetical protein Q9212_005841 [Teloschistes hypoglaucus]
MAPLISWKKAYWFLATCGASYVLFVSLLTNPFVQRHALYLHKVHTTWWQDPNKPEQFGFLSVYQSKFSFRVPIPDYCPENQVQPFSIQTLDGETLYAWHVLPIAKYATNQQALVSERTDSARSFEDSVAFDLLSRDPTSRLLIYFHGNAGTVAQGWRTDTYRALSSGASDKIHVLAIDYRGFGYSTGAPDEQGLVKDGIATVRWAMDAANIPPDRIILVGQSLGTAVAAAVAEHYVQESQLEFAGTVLVAAFSDLPTLLLTYSIGGIVPILSPLRPYPSLQRFFSRYLRDTWLTSTRVENLVRMSQKMNLYLFHSRDDFEIPWKHSETLFYAAANATSSASLSSKHIEGMKFQQDLQEGGTLDSWNAGGMKKITKHIVRYGGKRQNAAKREADQPFQLRILQAKMTEESKLVDSAVNAEAVQYTLDSQGNEATSAEDVDEEETADGETADAVAAGSVAKKKKSKKAKIKRALGVSDKKEGDASGPSSSANPASKLTTGMVEQLLEMNPALKKEVAGLNKEQASEASVSGKNQKDMASYKFWQTQPVPRFDETQQFDEGPIKRIDPEQVPKEAQQLLEGFEWVTMDLTNDKELEEVYELLNGHYVEDDEAMFRFNYSQSFLNWALKAPGWRKEWHVGVRASKSRKLVAFISGVPISLRVRSTVLKSTEINFLCIHKKLRSKRLAPVLIQEITRRCYQLGIFQAIYTAGIVLPKPVSSCRYFHRSLDWLKLFEVGFSPMPKNSSKARQMTKYKLPESTSTRGLRPTQRKDVPAVLDLLQRYLKRFELAPEFDAEEVNHWMVHDEKTTAEQVIWTYVVEDPSSHKITDFFSFYCLESSVIKNPKHDTVRAAYLFYYATEAAFAENEKGLKDRLNGLMNDALVLAKRFNFDVFNALTLLDNPLFLEQQKYGPGDGQLHYYIYNYRAHPLAGGVNAKNDVDENRRGGVGVVML